MRFDRQVVDWAETQLGRPYLWAGRGEWYVRYPEMAVEPVVQAGVTDGGLAFDCAGLVTWASLKAGAKDLRGGWGADQLWRALPAPGPGDPLDAITLAFFGTPARASHVTIHLGRGRHLEAGGGDSSTTTFVEARRVRAAVRYRWAPWRRDFLGEKSLLAVAGLPKQPPK